MVARCGVAELLGHLLNMEQRGAVGCAHAVDALCIQIAKSGVVPAFSGVNIEAAGFGVVVYLESGEGGRNVLFGGLIFLGHRYAVAIVPHGNGQGHLEYTCGIHRFPKSTLGGGGIANGYETDLIAIVGQPAA